MTTLRSLWSSCWKWLRCFKTLLLITVLFWEVWYLNKLGKNICWKMTKINYLIHVRLEHDRASIRDGRCQHAGKLDRGVRRLQRLHNIRFVRMDDSTFDFCFCGSAHLSWVPNTECEPITKPKQILCVTCFIAVHTNKLLRFYS